MLEGTTYPVTINVSTDFLSAFERKIAGECRWEYMVRVKTLAGSKPVTVPSNGFSNRSSNVVASSKCLRRMQENYM